MSRYHLRTIQLVVLLSLQPITSFQPLPPLKYSSSAAAATKNPWRRCAITSTVPSTPPRSNNPLQRLRRPRSPLVAKRLQGKKKFATRSQQATSTLLRVALPTLPVLQLARHEQGAAREEDRIGIEESWPYRADEVVSLQGRTTIS